MHLLVIEDEELLAKNLKRVLESQGFIVDVLTSGRKALSRILMYRELYSLIILDLGLPDLDGSELIAQLRGNGLATPLIVLTGRAEMDSKVQLLNAGADDYMVKPFSLQELIARINTVLRRPEARKPTVETLGSLTVDTGAHRVRLGEYDVELTPKEYSLFENLMRRPGEVVTRDELAGGAWDFEAVAWSNVLDVHMKNLRRKIGGSASARIETVRGVGYRLVVESI